MLNDIVYNDDEEYERFGYIVDYLEKRKDKIVVEMSKTKIRYWCESDEIIFLKVLMKRHPWIKLVKYFENQ